jgi:hypothetical protein
VGAWCHLVGGWHHFSGLDQWEAREYASGSSGVYFIRSIDTL